MGVFRHGTKKWEIRILQLKEEVFFYAVKKNQQIVKNQLLYY